MRALKALVIIMAILIFAGGALVVVTIVKRAGDTAAEKPAGPPASAAPETPRGFGQSRLELPAGSQIVEMTTQGERLVLRLGLGDGSEQILFIDMGSGKTIGTLVIGHGP